MVFYYLRQPPPNKVRNITRQWISYAPFPTITQSNPGSRNHYNDGKIQASRQHGLFVEQPAKQDQAFSLALALFLGRSTAWMLGRTPPWAIVTPARSLFSSSSFLDKTNDERMQITRRVVTPDGQLKVPWDDTRLLVVPGSIASKLKNLGSQVLHDGGHVNWSPCTHPLGIISLPDES